MNRVAVRGAEAATRCRRFHIFRSPCELRINGYGVGWLKTTRKREVIGVAATKTAKNPTRGNDTPNTPEVSESAIAAMKVGELRRRLQGRGVKGTADLKKAELVKKLIKLETKGSGSGRKNPTSGNDTPNTPEVSESAIAAMKVGELRRRLQGRGVKGTADLKKAELVKKLIKLETTAAKPARSTTKKSTSPAATRSAKKSTSAATSRSAKKPARAATDRSTTKRLASAAGKLPTTKKLLFAQTDPPSGNDLPATLEVGRGRPR